MRLLSCIVTYNRLAYTRRCIDSYLSTVGDDARLVVVDNASTDGTRDYLQRRLGRGVDLLILNSENRYPGAACNAGWDYGLEHWPAELLHRSDNDIEYLPGWRAEVEAQFRADPDLSLLGILNLHEDGLSAGQGVEIVPRVGGNVVMPAGRFELVHWNEAPWSQGVDEDGPMSEAAGRLGTVGRLRRTVVNNMAFGRFADYPDYYRETAAVRGYPVAELTV